MFSPRRKTGHAGRAGLLVLVVALTAGVVGPAIPAGPDAGANLLQQAMALAPKQLAGTAGEPGDDPAGPANTAGPKSLQSKYPAVAAGEAKVAANAVQVRSAPAHVTGFDEKTSRELPDRRTATDKTYANTDGTLTTEFGQEPINFRAPDGSYQPIDTTIVPAGTGWSNAADAERLTFAAKAGGTDLVHVTLDGEHEFGYGVGGAVPTTGAVSGSRIVYPGVRPGADLRLDVVPGGVKETLVLNSPETATTWDFPLRLKGLRPSLVDGRISLTDASGAERARIPAGFMTDSRRDPATGDPARSEGVTYELLENAGAFVLRVKLDPDWLKDSARVYPVEVDPSVETTASDGGAVFQGGSRLDGSTELRIGTTGSVKAASYLSFSGVESRLRDHKILGAQLTLKSTWSWSCQPRPVTVHGVTAPWNTASGFPGPAFGPALAQESFAHGYIGLQQHASSCPSATELIPLGTAGRDLVQRWVTGAQANYGLAVRASETDPYGWKKFTGNRTANPPRLFVTHTAYDAEYRVDRGVPQPPVTRTQAGKVKITVTNRGAGTWTAADFALGYRVFTAAGAPVGAVEAASLPNDVPRGASVTLDATIKAIEPGQYLFDFSMLRRGGAWFTDEQIPPTRLSMTVFDVPPIVKAQYPPNGFSAPTLTPQLWADAVDVDAPVSSTLKYRFEVCEKYVAKPDGTLTGVSCVDSGYVTKRTWTVPTGALRWSKDYQWRVFAYDGNSESEKLTPSHLLTAVPQPEITSHLANAPYSGAQRDFDPQTGNYFSSAVDAALQVTGPELTVARTYNSLDPRTDLAFGAGWSTRYDMRVLPDNDGSGNVVITYPDGQQVRFGRNSDGTFAPPPGRQANFRIEPEAAGGGWVLNDKAAALYRFRPDGRLIEIYDQAGHHVQLDYGTPEHLSRAISLTSDRILYFKWTGNHVTSVSTDPIDGKQLTWTYTYDGDRLTKVCDPDNGCTGYDYTTGSHYRSSVVDARPSSFWRFGETSGTSAASENGLKLGKDAGTYKDVALGQPGPLAGTGTAATFNGTSSVVTLPDGTVRKNRDLAIEMWFKTTAGGPLFGYQKAPISGTPTGAVPVLYVGTDGKLRGQFWNGGAAPITSAATVNDNAWHHVVLSGALATQTLYLDGKAVGTAQGEIAHDDVVYNQIGAAYTVPPSAWPGWGTDARRFFSGQIAEAAFYEYAVGPTTAAAHYQARAAASSLTKITLPSGRVAAQLSYDTAADRLTEVVDRNGGHWRLGKPVVTGTETNLVRTTQVTDPGDRPHFYDYDPVRGRILRYIAPLGQGIRPEDRRDGDGNPLPPENPTCDPSAPQDPADPSYCGGPVGGDGTWVGGPVNGQGVRTYDYDDKGFQTTIGDELGNTVVLTNDERGNVLARKTCRVAPGDCQTSYSTYYLNAADVTDPRNDKLLSTRDARSANADDPAYATTYTYTDLGVRGLLATETTPDGGVTRHQYATGTEAAAGGGNVPAGLLLQTTDPRNGVTTYAYYKNGDLAKVTDPAGLTTAYTYDVFGRKKTETRSSASDPAGVTTTYAYDSRSHQTAVTGPGVVNAITGVTHTAQTLTGYDADGNVVRTEEKDLTGGDTARVTTTDYDDFGRASRVVDPEGGVTSSGYDPFGNRVWMVDAGGNKYEYGYTARNALAEVRLRAWNGQAVDPASGAGDTDGAGDTTSAPTLVLASYAYDLAGRRVRETASMGRTTRYRYFGDGKVWKVVAHDVRDPFNPAAPKRDVTLQEYAYDAAGQKTKLTEPGGRVTTFEYDAAGRGTAETTDPAGLANRTEWTYGPGGDVVKTVHTGQSSNSTRLDLGNRETVEYGYDTAGRQTSRSVTKSATEKLTTTYQYDERGLTTAVTAPRGNARGADPVAFTTNLAYDKLGRLIRTTQPLVAAESGGAAAAQVRPEVVGGYDTFGNQTETKDPNGNVGTITYDRDGRIVKVASPDYRKPGETTAAKAATTRQYDALGNLLNVTDPAGAVTRYRYDQLGRPVERTDPDPAAGDQPGGVWSYGYTTEGELLSTTDPTGSRVEATYDDLGRQVTATRLERRPAPAAYTTKLRYDDAGNLVSSTAPTGELTKNEYDVLGQRTTTTDPAGVVSRFGYDFAGRQVRQSDGHGRTGYVSYDPAGRATGFYSLDPAERVLRKSSVGYDADSNKVTASDALGRTTRFDYDSRGLLVRQQEPTTDTTSITTSFGYDAAGNRTRSTDGRGNSTIETYNALGLPESVLEPATAAHPAAADRTWTTSYDLAGRPERVQAPGGVVRQRTFDALGRLTLETGTGAAQPTPDRVQRFDPAGRLLAVNAPSGEKTFTYDDRGDLLTSTGPLSGTSAYSYDGSGRLTQRVDGAGTAVFTYQQGRLSTQQDGLTGVKQTLGYDDAGNLASIDYGSGRFRTYGYDDFGRQTSDELKAAGGVSLAALAYSYDLDDRLTGKKTTGVAGAGDNTYGYDQAGRLTSWTVGGKTTSYTWDASGNRVQAGDRTATFDERNRQLTDGTDTLTWSARGTLNARTGPAGTTTSEFDAFDRAVKQGSVTYAYDGLDRASSRNDQTLSYDGTSLDLTSDGTSTFARGTQGDLQAQGMGGTGQLAVTDQHADVIGGLSPTGALTGSATFDPFGAKVAQSGTTSPLGFQSDYTDPATGAVDMGARWYTPGTGTFSARDDIDLPVTPSGMANRYVYGGGAPVDHVDPDGHFRIPKPTPNLPGVRGTRVSSDPLNDFLGFLPYGFLFQIQKTSVGTATRGSVRYFNSGGGSYWVDPSSDRDWNPSWNPDAGTQPGNPPQPGGCRACSPPPRGCWCPPPPPPPPPGIQARIDQNEKARTVADPIPDGAKNPYYGGGGVSSDPDLPAGVVAGLLGDLQDLVSIYQGFVEQILDPKNPVVHDVDPPVPSPLLPTQVSAWDNCGGGVLRDDFNGGTRRTNYLCDPLIGEVRGLADKNAPIRPDEDRPGVAEGIRLLTGEVLTHTSVRGSNLPAVNSTVQFVLDSIPLDLRGRGHGKCGLVYCLSDALDQGLDPVGADAAAFNIRNNAGHPKHNQPLGPCDSCRVLADYFGLNFVTEGLEWWTP
ncbi:RHS repeat-associated core domain-containing protein [Amycolatopsis eburnea]|uniref:DNRLRE domain-containing protein n=1 Tax=Amycolatopsis eburnea TaxID=2267691 RepID=A0A427TKJ3_9PSEU|nr:RHS repeat-associated core domain-containing protein [Amycolatopsis eburnea]RSD24867.1 DNRLRE domain-containing protein [Amycolatopsis eburnea]